MVKKSKGIQRSPKVKLVKMTKQKVSLKKRVLLKNKNLEDGRGRAKDGKKVKAGRKVATLLPAPKNKSLVSSSSSSRSLLRSSHTSLPKSSHTSLSRSLHTSLNKSPHKPMDKSQERYVHTGITGLDHLFEKGIPKATSVLVAGGAGSGKTILCLQSLIHAAQQGEKCLYISFEESEQRLKEHISDFGWDWKKLESNGTLKIVRKDPFILSTNIEAIFAHAKGELLIDLNDILEIIPQGFHPQRIVIDSLTALASSFAGQDLGYRLFMENFFRYLETLHVTTFLISETGQVPVKLSSYGAEEFLADGVIVLYSLRKQSVRENAIEVLKMRGAKHQKKIVAMQITDKGIQVYPDQEVFEKI
ncbi:AAA family ATPase [Candidatus Woesearchaeota archaeon]|nr:AAA family ATPase [Candidatus Woesearchaeota archaeon]